MDKGGMLRPAVSFFTRPHDAVPGEGEGGPPLRAPLLAPVVGDCARSGNVPVADHLARGRGCRLSYLPACRGPVGSCRRSVDGGSDRRSRALQRRPSRSTWSGERVFGGPNTQSEETES